MKNSVFSKMAANRGIIMLRFLEAEVIVEILNGSYWDDDD